MGGYRQEAREMEKGVTFSVKKKKVRLKKNGSSVELSTVDRQSIGGGSFA